jgi:hypothetical protein
MRGIRVAVDALGVTPASRPGNMLFAALLSETNPRSESLLEMCTPARIAAEPQLDIRVAPPCTWARRYPRHAIHIAIASCASPLSTAPDTSCRE